MPGERDTRGNLFGFYPRAHRAVLLVRVFLPRALFQEAAGSGRAEEKPAPAQGRFLSSGKERRRRKIEFILYIVIIYCIYACARTRAYVCACVLYM